MKHKNRKGKKDKSDETFKVRTSDLLRTMATLDECEARIATDEEQRDGLVPDWCEVVLITNRGGTLQPQYFRRSDAELIMEVLREVLHPNHGQSLVQSLWALHDGYIDRLMAGGKKSDRAAAQALGKALALAKNPYRPDEDAIREEAMERYADRQPG